MIKWLIVLQVLLSTTAIASPVYKYDVYANPKSVWADSKNIRLADVEVKAVPTTYKMVEPINCRRDENDCRKEEVTVSREKVVQVSVSYFGGRTADYRHAEADYLEINLPLSSFTQEQLNQLASKKRKTRKQAMNQLVQLTVNTVKVPVVEEDCHLVNENYVCSGEYTREIKMKSVLVSKK
jgi:hypothetical protein